MVGEIETAGVDQVSIEAKLEPLQTNLIADALTLSNTLRWRSETSNLSRTIDLRVSREDIVGLELNVTIHLFFDIALDCLGHPFEGAPFTMNNTASARHVEIQTCLLHD